MPNAVCVYACLFVKGDGVGFGDSFVGQCEAFVCLDFLLTFFPLAAKLTGPQMGCQFFRNVGFSVT